MWRANLALAVFLMAWLAGINAVLRHYDNTPRIIEYVAAKNGAKCSACFATR